VLRYTTVNLRDAAETLGGFPFSVCSRWYYGSDNDPLLSLGVPRISARPPAVSRMNIDDTTSGILRRPLITMHTLKDQQVPFAHERICSLKTLASGALLTRHLNIPVNPFLHCNFTAGDVGWLARPTARRQSRVQAQAALKAALRGRRNAVRCRASRLPAVG
jgi:hypothetical protein